MSELKQRKQSGLKEHSTSGNLFVINFILHPHVLLYIISTKTAYTSSTFRNKTHTYYDIENQCAWNCQIINFLRLIAFISIHGILATALTFILTLNYESGINYFFVK